MSANVLQTVTNEVWSGTPATTIAVTLTVTAGSTLVVWGTNDSGGGHDVSTVADSVNGSHGAAVDNVNDATNAQRIFSFRKENCGAGSTTVTITYSASSTFRGICVQEWAGVKTSGALDGHAAQAQTPGLGTDATSSGSPTNTSQPAGVGAVTISLGASNANAGTGFTSSTTMFGGAARAEWRTITTTGAPNAGAAGTFTALGATDPHLTSAVVLDEATTAAVQIPPRRGAVVWPELPYVVQVVQHDATLPALVGNNPPVRAIIPILWPPPPPPLPPEPLPAATLPASVGDNPPIAVRRPVAWSMDPVPRYATGPVAALIPLAAALQPFTRPPIVWEAPPFQVPRQAPAATLPALVGDNPPVRAACPLTWPETPSPVWRTVSLAPLLSTQVDAPPPHVARSLLWPEPPTWTPPKSPAATLPASVGSAPPVRAVRPITWADIVFARQSAPPLVPIPPAVDVPPPRARLTVRWPEPHYVPWFSWRPATGLPAPAPPIVVAIDSAGLSDRSHTDTLLTDDGQRDAELTDDGERVTWLTDALAARNVTLSSFSEDSMGGPYMLGRQVTMSVVFDLNGTPTDPAAPTMKTRSPAGTEVTYVYPTNTELVKDSVGHYHLNAIPTIGGTWYYRSKDAAGWAEEKSFEVIRSHFANP